MGHHTKTVLFGELDDWTRYLEAKEASSLYVLLKESYRRVDGFTRKQVWLPTELGPLWTSHRDALQLEVVEGTLPQERTLNSMLADGVPRLVGKTEPREDKEPRPVSSQVDYPLAAGGAAKEAPDGDACSGMGPLF